MLLCAILAAAPASAQTITQRGFVQGAVFLYPQVTPTDTTRLVADALAREELFVKPASWLQLAAGVDLYAGSHDQVEDGWGIDVGDRGVQRPRVAIRRLAATLTYRTLAVDVGKQFIRWGKTDIVSPADCFAPRDFLNVLAPELLAVSGARATLQRGPDTFEAVWVPRLTPSRLPILRQRWAPVSSEVDAPLVDDGAVYPSGAQTGARWSHIGDRAEFAVSFFNGFNHLPTIDVTVTPLPPAVHVTRIYPAIRSYAGETAVPTPWFTIKGEAAYVTARDDAASDDYALYVVQIERQSGEWVFVGGYAGETVTTRRTTVIFAPDRGLTRSIVARASYTIDPRRSVAFEGAARQSGDGVYAKAEYSEARGPHWRMTIAAVGIAGANGDFLGQYRRNSHVAASLRYSF